MQGVYTKLRDPQVSWENKISIAQNAWSDEKCFIPNKQQVLLDWVCQKLVDHILYKKDKRPVDGEQISREVKDLWGYFKKILQNISTCKPLNGEDSVHIPLTLMPQLVQVFAKVFLDYSSSESCRFTSEQESDMLNIIHCGQMILSSSQLNTSFVAKFENYVMFMSSLLSLFVVFMININSLTNNEICNEMFHMLELSLSVYNSLQRRQTNHRKLFERTCGHIIGPLLTVRYIVKNIKLHVYQSDAKKITQDKITCFVNLLHRTLSDALFRRENLSDYLSTLKALKDKKDEDDTTEPQSKRACLGNYTKLLFDTLRNLLSCSDGMKQEAVMDILPQLYVDFLKARRENQMASSSLEFDFFTELCVLLGIDIDNTVINKHEKHISRILEYVHYLLDAILIFDVYQVGEDHADDSRQLKWFVKFTKLLLTYQSSFNIYPCLEVLLNLNHCIIVPHLNTILQWMYGSDTYEQDDVSSCDTFLSSVVKTYVKLRQFDRLISQMLESLRTTKTMNGPWMGFPDLVRGELIKACQSLPYGLSTSLWKTVNSEICHHYLPALQGLEEQAKTEHKSENKMDDLIFSLEGVVGLFSLFLLNTTLGGVTEQHTVETTKRTLSSLYHGSVDDVLGPLWEALSNMRDNKVFAQSLSVSVLILFHALQEIKIFLGKLGCISDELNIYWEKYIKGYLQKILRTKKQGNERLQYLLVLLCIQRTRVLLIQDSSAHCQTDFQQLLDHIFILSDTISYDNPSSWNKQVWTVNKTNISLAYWYCLCDKASLFLPVCTGKQRLKFTQCLIQSLVSTDVEPSSVQTRIFENVMSIQSTSKTLLHSAAFHLVPSMQDSLVSSLWIHVGEVLSSCNFTAQPHKKLVNIVTALGTLQVNGSVNDDLRDFDKEEESEDTDSEASEDESVSTSEGEEDISQVAQSTEKSLSKAVSPVLSLGKALDNALEVLESSKGVSSQASEKDLKESLKMLTNCLSMLACLPLDWLTDANHSACIIGLMACNTLLHSCLHQGENKECHRAFFLDHELINIMVNGCISKKRFLIHHVINLDSFLTWMLSSYLTSCQIEREERYLEQLESTSIHLICTLVKYLLKTASPASSVYSCINKMTDGIDGLTKELKKATLPSVTGIVHDNKPLLGVFCGVMDVLEKVIACKTSRLNEVRISAKLATNMAPTLLNLLGTIAAKNDKKRHSIKKGSCDAVKCLESVLQGLPVLIDSYSAVIHIYNVTQTSRKLSQTKEEFQQLQWRPILPSILTFAINSLQSPQQDTLQNATEKLKRSCLHLLDVLCLSLDTMKIDLPHDFHCSLLASLLSFLNKLECEKEENTEMRGKALESILSLLLSSPSDILVVLLKGLSNELTSKPLNENSVHRISTCVHVWSMILSGRFPKLKKKELCPVIPQVLMALQSLLQMSASNIDLIVLTLQAMTKLLSLGTHYVQSHHCSLAFHGSLLVPLNDSKERFPHLFQAQYGLLSSIMFHQSEAVYNSVQVFVTCVKNMLWSLGQHCNNNKTAQGIQDESLKPQLDSELVCAQKMA
ncbi:unhealthy ribosome biogenesis protein 2 homolog, partial [Actinia tenebrosa]|uniref:Unhealthy ribosome biogenesis protein 2 homolog n=1 Tax=Actinia tenebrosa TaxID=6105 RepID=A0A6P8HAQ2_ACTTE